MMYDSFDFGVAAFAGFALTGDVARAAATAPADVATRRSGVGSFDSVAPYYSNCLSYSHCSARYFDWTCSFGLHSAVASGSPVADPNCRFECLKSFRRRTEKRENARRLEEHFLGRLNASHLPARNSGREVIPPRIRAANCPPSEGKSRALAIEMEGAHFRFA